MNLKRFFGKNSREALNMVRRALGENAVIISNRAFEGGNEIIAVREEDMKDVYKRQVYYLCPTAPMKRYSHERF